MFRTLYWKCAGCAQIWVKTNTVPEDTVVENDCKFCKELSNLIPYCVDCDIPVKECRCKEGIL